MMKQRIYILLNLSLLLLLGLSFYFSLQSVTLTLTNDTSLVLMIVVFIATLLLFLFVFQRAIFRKFFCFLHWHSTKIFWILFFLLIIYQLILINVLEIEPLYDSFEVLSRLDNPKTLDTFWLYPGTKINYLSGYSNNQFFFFFNYGLSKFIGTDIIVFTYLNIVLIDLSVIVLKKVCENVFNSKAVGIVTALLVMFYAGAQTFFLVPYTDTYLLLPLSLALFFMTLAWKQKGIRCFFYAVLSGLFSTVTFLFKPSAIIYIIAIGLIILLNIDFFFSKGQEVKKKKETRNAFVSILLFFLSFFLCIRFFNLYVIHQDIVKIEPNQTVPWTHFLLMGSWGDENKKGSVTQSGLNLDYATIHGGWNPTDYKTTFEHSNIEDQKRAGMEAFINRTKERGFLGTLKFYLIKYSDITDTGVMGFHRDGQWFRVIENAPKGSRRHMVQQWFYPEGEFRAIFNYICQVVWLISLTLSIFGLWFRRKDKMMALISLTLFGGILFLGIFESGGTKYMIQYIPFLSLIASLGLKEGYRKFVKQETTVND